MFSFVLAVKILLALLVFIAVGAAGVWYCLRESDRLVDKLFGRNTE